MQSSLTYTGAPDMQLDDTKTTETKYVPVERMGSHSGLLYGSVPNTTSS